MSWIANAPAEVQNAWVLQHREVPLDMLGTWQREKQPCRLTLPAVEALWSSTIPATTARAIASTLESPEALAHLLKVERRKTVLEDILRNPHTPTQAMADVADARHICKHTGLEGLICRTVCERGTYQQADQLGLVHQLRPGEIVAAARDNALLGLRRRESAGKLWASPVRLRDRPADDWVMYFRACMEYRIPVVPFDPANASDEQLAALWDGAKMALTPGTDPELWSGFISRSSWSQIEWKRYRLTRPRLSLVSPMTPGTSTDWADVRPNTASEDKLLPEALYHRRRRGGLHPEKGSLDAVVRDGRHVAWSEIEDEGDVGAATADLLCDWLATAGPLVTAQWGSLWRSRPVLNDHLERVHVAVADSLAKGWEEGYYGHEYAALAPFCAPGGSARHGAAPIESPLDILEGPWKSHVGNLPLTEQVVETIFSAASGHFAKWAGQVFTERIERDAIPGAARSLFACSPQWEGFDEKTLSLLTPEDIRALRDDFSAQQEWMYAHKDIVGKYILVPLADGEALDHKDGLMGLMLYDLTPLAEAGLLRGGALRAYVDDNPTEAAALVAERLGSDPNKWWLLESLYSDWSGSLPDLIDTVIELTAA